MSKKKPLDRLAQACGIQLRYRSELGTWHSPSDEAKRATLAAMGIVARDTTQLDTELAEALPPLSDELTPPVGRRCFLPDWLREDRAWGVTCQLYGLRSNRNHGIGDFEDLARLAETLAADGADFIGVNPLHALFTAVPDRCSPFSPSSRLFLNPLYIALDRIPGIETSPAVDEAERRRLNAATHVAYAKAGAFKMDRLREVWSRISARPEIWAPDVHARFAAFVAAGGERLRHHAWFEALSHAMVARHRGGGWHDWPEEFQDARAEAVQRFVDANADEVRFHLWLQWVADEQLGAAKHRARAAGMRIGLYLDFALGTAPDGSATWSDPDLVVAGARIGAPPDAFHHAGQDWGLAPLSPATLRKRRMEPLRALIEHAMRHAGALRLDHVMNIYRLYWIPHGMTGAGGCYVLYPLQDMLGVLSEVSAAKKAILIGEDLGTVPDGFSEMLQAVNIMSSAVLYFEQDKTGFYSPSGYPRHAFATVSTHDLPTLAAWWTGGDIDLGYEIGQIDAAEVDRRRETRRRERHALLSRLRGVSRRRAQRREETGPLTPAIAAEVHGFLARTPSRLLGIQLDDLCGVETPVNLPGTTDEYPNWRRRLPIPIEDVRAGAFYKPIVDAVAAERPKVC